MDIPLKAPVECIDGLCGRSEYVLVNPVIGRVTYVVVKEEDSPRIEHIVPLEALDVTAAPPIRLQRSRKDFERMELFIKTSLTTPHA